MWKHNPKPRSLEGIFASQIGVFWGIALEVKDIKDHYNICKKSPLELLIVNPYINNGLFQKTIDYLFNGLWTPRVKV